MQQAADAAAAMPVIMSPGDGHARMLVRVAKDHVVSRSAEEARENLKLRALHDAGTASSNGFKQFIRNQSLSSF